MAETSRGEAWVLEAWVLTVAVPDFQSTKIDSMAAAFSIKR